jgi:hypothetical protein
MRVSFIITWFFIGTALAVMPVDLGVCLADPVARADCVGPTLTTLPPPPPVTLQEQQAQAEWKRWHAIANKVVKTVPAPADYLVPIDLEAFAEQSTWTRVLELCRDAGHTCELDTLIGELGHASWACQYCNADGTAAVGYGGVTDEGCRKCTDKLSEVRLQGQDPARQVTARVSRKVVHNTDQLPPKK